MQAKWVWLKIYEPGHRPLSTSPFTRVQAASSICHLLKLRGKNKNISSSDKLPLTPTVEKTKHMLKQMQGMCNLAVSVESLGLAELF